MVGVEVTLYDDDVSGSTVPQGTLLKAVWFDAAFEKAPPEAFGLGTVVEVGAEGLLKLDLRQISGLAVGDKGFLLLYKPDLADFRDALVFYSELEVVAVTGAQVVYPETWERPSNWLPLDVSSGQQKMQGLLRVLPEGNFVAFAAEGAYIVDWGDGSAPENFSSGSTAQKNISYNDIDPDTELGLENARGATLDGSSDTITLVGHKYVNAQQVAFAELSGVTGLTEHQPYYVRDATADTFKLALSPTGGVVDFSTTSMATGEVFVLVGRQCVVTLTMQAAQTLTSLTFDRRHTSLPSALNAQSWLEIQVAGASLNSLTMRGSNHSNDHLRAFAFRGPNALTSISGLFQFCDSLVAVEEFDATGVTTAADAFQLTPSLRFVRLQTSSALSNVSGMFSNSGLVFAPMFDTSSVTDFSSLMSSIPLLRFVPKYDTASGTNFNRFLFGCSSVRLLPAFDLSSAQNLSEAFEGCESLVSISIPDLPNVTLMNRTLFNCRSLTEVSDIYAPNLLNIDNAFSLCVNLERAPAIQSNALISVSSAFSTCSRLREVPVYNTAAVTNFSSMFSGCSSLAEVPALDVSAASSIFSFTNMFSNCQSLRESRIRGARYGMSYANARLSGAALNRIYQNLGTPVGSQTITVSNNWGTASDNPALVPSGWTVSGS